MTTSKERILARLRRRGGVPDSRPRAPERTSFDRELLYQQLTFQPKCDVRRLPREDVPRTIEDIRESASVLEEDVFVSRHPVLDAIAIPYKRGMPSPSTKISVTVAEFAVPRGGALVAHSPDNPHLASFISHRNIILVDSTRVVSSLSEALIAIGPRMPRALSIIGGPSKTGDLGFERNAPAQGPLQLHLLVISGLESLTGT